MYNFVRVFEKAFSPAEDLARESANVIKWRHKVAAHTAWAWPKKDDSVATQDMSIVLFPEFNCRFDGHFEVGGFRLFSEKKGKSCAEWRWGLVRTHERLKEIVRSVILLKDITDRGAQIREQLRQLLPDKYPADTKITLLLAYVDIALEHHEAIWLLTKSRLYGSAFAMVRLVYDAMLRAFWINKVATEQQIEQAIDDEFGFPLEKILAEIKRDYFSDRPPEEAQKFDSFLQLIKQAWRPMCSYTHSGALQLARRFTGDELKPNYKDGEIAEALNLVTVALLLLLHTFFVSMKCQQEAEEAGRMLVQWNFGERLRAAAVKQ